MAFKAKHAGHKHHHKKAEPKAITYRTANMMENMAQGEK